MYLPLPSRRSIRLLTIFPGSRDDIIRVKLTIVNLDDNPAYEALSYVWGDPSPATKILCDDQSFEVTPNLGSALQRLRYEGSSRFRVVWIDAICINQSDLDERSQQVSFMREIYGQAEHVVVWLGEDDGTVTTAISIIQRAAHYAREEAGVDVPEIQHLLPEWPRSVSSNKKDLPPLDHQDWSAVQSLFRRAWFRRIWVLQEVVRAERVTMLIGTKELSWLDAAAASLWLVRKHLFTGVEDVKHISKAMVIHQARKSCGLLMKLRLTALFFEASDPRDKVYAMLGLSFEAGELECGSLLAPDYRKSVAQVYGDVVRYFITKPNLHRGETIWGGMGEGVLDILGNWITGEEALHAKAGSSEDFPTWVPRWDLTPTGTRIGLTSYAVSSLWAATKDSKVMLLPSDSPRSLSLRGIRITTITLMNRALEPYWKLVGCTDEDKELFVKEMLEATMGAIPNYGGPATLHEAFASVITALGSKNELNSLDSILEPCHEEDLDAFLRDGLQSEKGRAFASAISFTQTLFVTESGHLGLGHPNMERGDQICVLFGGKVLYIIRRVGMHFEFVGECYVYGYMKGEAMDLWKSGRLRDEWIELR